MIISVEKAKALIQFDDSWTDEKIEMKLKSIEQTIRAYTNNNFQVRGYRIRANIRAGVFMSESHAPFSIGDTIQVSEAQYNNGLFVISSIPDDLSFTATKDPRDEDNVLITKVVYPADVIDCCLNLLEWEINHRGKVGIQSETLSRHSVTYFNMDGGNSVMGYPVSLLGCLKAYRKARC